MHYDKKKKRTGLHYKNPFFIFMLMIVIGVTGYFAWTHFRIAPEVIVPGNLAQLDPAVRELIHLKANAATARPRDASAHGDLGLCYEANSLWQEARASFETASKLDPNEMLWKLHLAIAYRQTGAYEKALELLTNLSQQHPDSSPIQQRLGHALAEHGDLKGAESAFRKLIALAPDSPYGYAGLGDLLLQKRDYQQAVPILEKAVSLDPSYRTSHYLLGTAYQRIERRDRAEVELAQGTNAAIQFLPDPATETVQQFAVSLTARVQQAEQELHSGNHEQAAKLLELALTHHPANVSVLNNLAIAYMRMGQIQKAEALLVRAQQRDHGQFMTALNFSSLMLRTGRVQQALDFADSAIRLAPNLDRGYFSRSLALLRLGRSKEALISIEEALRQNPKDPQNHAFAGDLYLQEGANEKAQESYDNALKLNPEMLPALVGKARANFVLGHYSEAEAALNRARKIAPNHPLVRRLGQQLQSAPK